MYLFMKAIFFFLGGGGGFLTRSIRDSESSIDSVQGSPGSRRERVNMNYKQMLLEYNRNIS